MDEFCESFNIRYTLKLSSLTLRLHVLNKLLFGWVSAEMSVWLTHRSGFWKWRGSCSRAGLEQWIWGALRSERQVDRPALRGASQTDASLFRGRSSVGKRGGGRRSQTGCSPPKAPWREKSTYLGVWRWLTTFRCANDTLMSSCFIIVMNKIYGLKKITADV